MSENGIVNVDDVQMNKAIIVCSLIRTLYCLSLL